MSRTRTRTPAGDPTPVTGGVKTPARLLRPVAAPDTAPAESIDRHILRLLTLHKDVCVKFRGVDLAKMDDAAKQALLTDIQDLLGIDPVPFPRGATDCSTPPQSPG